MNVLVAHASRHGSTAEIAAAVTETLRRSGLHGSAVYMRRWRGDAPHFLRRHAKALAELPFWVFSSGATGPPTEDHVRAAA
jgi:menaquinone-dependent protoporphyrinogen oxidase